MTDHFTDGVVGAVTNTAGVAPATGGLAVNQHSGADTKSSVTAGIAYVTATPTSQGSQRLRVKIDAQDITHSSNSSGGTRYDWIYVAVSASLAANPIADMSTTGTIVVSRSTSSSIDNGTPPTYGYCIAKVTLANGFTAVTNAQIADVRSRSTVAALPVGINTGSTTATVATGQSTATGYATDLATSGPSVTVTIGTNGIALVILSSFMSQNTNLAQAFLGIEISGANTIAADTDRCLSYQALTGMTGETRSGAFMYTGLTPGSTTFKLKYGQGGGGTAGYSSRRISVVPL